MLTLWALLLATLLGQSHIHINGPVGGPPGGPVAADQAGGGPSHASPPGGPVAADQTGGGPSHAGPTSDEATGGTGST